MPIPAATTARSWRPGGDHPPAGWLAAGQSASARMPATLRSGALPSPGHTRSLGHFTRSTAPVTASTASAAATASAMVVSPATEAGGRSSTVAMRAPPGGASQVRPRRPRPAVW